MRPRLFAQIYLPAIFILAALLAYSGNLNSYFISDDFVQIGKVLHRDFSVAWGQEHGGFFRPLFILSYIIDSRIWHDRPFGFHLTNVLLHALNSLAIFKLGQRLFYDLKLPAKSVKAATGAAAVLFLVHPSHTEAVTWISGRADLLATLFCLAALWSYCAYLNARRIAYLVLALGLGAMALLAKESAICLPFLILIVGLYFSRGRKVLMDFGLFVLLVMAFIVVRAAFLGAIVGGYGSGQHLNFHPGWIRDRLLEAVGRSILPVVPPAWSWFLFKPLQSPLFILIALTILGALAGAVVFRRRRYEAAERTRQNRLLLVLVGLFLSALLPVINLRLYLYQTLGERFLYLPTVFSCLLIGYLSIILVRNHTVWLVLLICALGFYSWRLYVANRLWHDAAQLTRSIKDDLTASSSQTHLTILNVPDNLRGVPVFHNGLPEALQFFQAHTPIASVEINAFQSLQLPADENSFYPADDTFTLELVNRLDTFNRATSSECLELLSQSADALKLRRKPCLTTTEVYFLSGGRMRPAFQRQ
jgi:4-amino-4-deoxy-L-arabinose transferase-like glycosyltransferase